MTPPHEEALRLLRLADPDLAVLAHIKNQESTGCAFLMVCFHAQQALEKSLKAMLFERQMGFETHDLERLAGLLAAERVELPCTLDEPRTAWHSSPRLCSS